MAGLLVVYQEGLRAATAMLISEIIARAPTMGMNERNAVCGIASLLVARREVLHAVTELISEIIARVLTREMIELTVVYGTVNLPVVFQGVLHAVMIFEIIAQAQAMARIIVSADDVKKAGYIVGKVQFKYLVSTMLNLLQRIFNQVRNIRNTTEHTSQFGRRNMYYVLAYDKN